MKKGTVTVFMIFLVVSAFILIPISGCGLVGNRSVDGNINGTEELEPVEISEYEGTKLGSVNDFKENSIKGPQQLDVETYQLKITGLVENPKNYTYDEVISKNQHYKKVVRLDCVEGWSVTILWEGLLVKDLLAEVNPLPNSKVVIFHAYDGYTTSLPIDYIMNRISLWRIR